MEKNIRQCKVCGNMKDHILEKKFASNEKKFIDSTGKQWNGKTCPDCHRNRVKIDKRNNYAIKK